MKIRVMIDTENPGDFRGYDEAGDELDLVYVLAKWTKDGPEVAFRWRPAIEAVPSAAGNGHAGRFYGLDRAVATRGEVRPLMAAYFQGEGAGPGDTEYFGPLRADGLDAVMVYSSGLDADWYFIARSVDQDLPVLAFDPGITVDARIWAGTDEPELVTLSGVWLDPAQGTGKLAIAAADGALLDTGTYNIRATLAADVGDFELHSGLFRVLPAPGDRESPSGPQYSSVEEIREYAYWLDDARMAEGNSAGLVRAIDRASRWADTVAVSRARRAFADLRTWPYSFDWLSDDRVGTNGPDAFGRRIADALANGQLDDSDPRLREAVARYAISQVPGGERKPGDMADDQRRAIALMLGVVLHFDLDDDGIYETGIGP